MRLARTAVVAAFIASTACGGADTASHEVDPTRPQVTASTPSPDPEPTPTVTEPSETPLTPAPDGAVALTLKDFWIEADHSGSEVGAVTFAIDNAGNASHEVIVYRTDLPADDLPLDGDGKVDDESDQIEMVAELRDILYQSQQTWTVELEPGSYALVCNLPSHYRRGMYAPFEVTA